MRTHQQIAEDLLGCPLDPDGYAPCPGAHLHTTRTGRRDFQLFIDPAGIQLPHEHCFHASCQPARDEFMARLYSAIKSEQGGTHPPAQQALRPLPPQPTPRKYKPCLDMVRAQALAAHCPHDITPAYLRSISPIAIPESRYSWAELLIDTLYRPGERILVFTRFASQGQFIRVAGRGNYRLSPWPGTPAQPIANLPSEGAEGCWFLCSPVLGTWQPNPHNTKAGRPRLGRRHTACCTRFPYAVLESDTIPPALWLRILAQITDPIAAIYTSGGKSIHALISAGDITTTEQFNVLRDKLRRRLTPVGVDPAALTAVRLTRLPGALRHNKCGEKGQPALQELYYLNPRPCPGRPLLSMPQLR